MSHYRHLSIEEREKRSLIKGEGRSLRRIAQEMGRASATLSRERSRNKPRSNRTVRQKRSVATGRGAFSAGKSIFCARPRSGSTSAGCFRRHTGLLMRYRIGSSRRRLRCSAAMRPSAAPSTPDCLRKTNEQPAGAERGSCLLSVVDRKSRFTPAAKLPDRSARSARDTMILLLILLPPDRIKSITPDRGSGFALYRELSAAAGTVPFYFADPHAPWQCGANENPNGRIKRMTAQGIRYGPGFRRADRQHYCLTEPPCAKMPCLTLPLCSLLGPAAALDLTIHLWRFARRRYRSLHSMSCHTAPPCTDREIPCSIKPKRW